MDSVFILMWDQHLNEPADTTPIIISAHPTEQSAKSAERFFLGYDERFKKHQGQVTWIEEVEFST